jgi:hypothetical protein
LGAASGLNPKVVLLLPVCAVVVMGFGDEPGGSGAAEAVVAIAPTAVTAAIANASRLGMEYLRM